jgi:Flp pilus assembly protein TadD
MSNIQPYIQKAEILLEQGRARDAEKQLGEALKHDPENHRVLCLLGKCKYDLKEFAQGISLIQRAIHLAPDEDYYYYLLGFGYYHLNNSKEAIGCVRQACMLNPYASPYFGLWALILIDENKFEEGLEKANEGLAIDPTEITCLNARSTALNKLKRTADAIATMHNALEQDPENEFTHTTIGWNFLEKGKLKEATSHFTEALRINPNMESARIGLKESLKSKLPPYKWLLQYSFWVNNKGKSARWIIPIGIYVAVRVFGTVSKTAGPGWQIAGVVVAVLYLVFVATTWIINPLANLILLNSKHGRYALTPREKMNALFFAAAMVAGLALICVGAFLHTGELSTNTIFAGVIAMSLSLPLGHMDFPIQWRDNAPSQWLAMILLATGAAAIICGTANLSFAGITFMIYAIAFVPFIWISAFSKK